MESKDVQLHELQELAAPLMKYLRENHNPYCMIIVEDDRARLVESIAQIVEEVN